MLVGGLVGGWFLLSIIITFAQPFETLKFPFVSLFSGRVFLMVLKIIVE